MNEARFRRLPVRGVELLERRVGEGPEVIILHGGPGAHHDYLLPGFDALARGRTLVYYDQRGGGQSPVPRHVPVGAAEQVADLEALRGVWQAEALHLVGHSWGALLALLYGLAFPGRLASLALVSPAPSNRAARREFEARLAARSAAPALQAEREALRASGLAASDPPAYQRRSFLLAVAGYFHDPRRAGDMTPFRITGRTQQEVWDSLGEYDLRPDLARLRVPAVVLHGDDDPIVPDTALDTARRIGAAWHLLPDCGHVPHVEAPGPFTAILDAALPRDAR